MNNFNSTFYLNNNSSILFFEEPYDVSHITNDKKAYILFSNMDFILLLKEILQNKRNQNVLLKKDSIMGNVFMKGNKTLSVNINNICHEIIEKLNYHLNLFLEDFNFASGLSEMLT